MLAPVLRAAWVQIMRIVQVTPSQPLGEMVHGNRSEAARAMYL